jgi:hypothetical protein
LAGGAPAGFYHFWPGPDDPQSYRDGANAQATADARKIPALQTATANNVYATAMATSQEEKRIKDRKDWVDKQRKDVAALVTSKSWQNNIYSRWEQVYSGRYHTTNFTSDTAVADSMMYETRVNDFVRQESNLFLGRY